METEVILKITNVFEYYNNGITQAIIQNLAREHIVGTHKMKVNQITSYFYKRKLICDQSWYQTGNACSPKTGVALFYRSPLVI